MMKFSSFVALCLLTGPAIAEAQNQTVHDRRALRWEVATWDLTQIGAAMEFVAIDEGYRYDVLLESVSTLNPTATLPGFISILQTGYGWFYFASHGNPGSIDVETYPLTPAGLNARNNALANYIAQGFSPAEVGASQGNNHYGIAVAPSFCFSRFVSNNTLVDLRACLSLSMQSGFPNAATLIGYDYICTNATEINETTALYSRMAGWQGTGLRPTGPAHSGATSTLLGATNLVLAPIVSNVTPPPGSSLLGLTTGRIDFDCPMNTAFPAINVLEHSSGITIPQASWNGSSRIDFLVNPIAPGPSTVRVRADTSTIVYSARSFPGLIPLDGNTKGGVAGSNGHSPNGDDYRLQLSSLTGGDNPLAAVVGFAAFRDSGVVKARWKSLFEVGTHAYILQRAPSWDEEFTSIDSTLALGPGSYLIVVPNSPDSVYRLLEVETDGDTLVQVVEALWPAPPPSVAQTSVPSIGWADSVFLALQAAYPPPTTPQESITFTYLIFAPEDLVDEAQILASYWSNTGQMWTRVLPLPETPSEIKSIIEEHRPYVRHVLLFGDANDHAGVDGILLWPDLSKWTNGFVQPPYPSQSALNAIPMAYELETAPILQSLSRSTPWRASDWWYVDFDDDGLPDISIGRAPVHNEQEAIAFVLKTLNAATIVPSAPYMNHIGLWVYAQDFLDPVGGPRMSGAFVEALAHTVASAIPSAFVVDSLVDRPRASKSASERATLARAALSQGRSLVITMGTTSNRYQWSGWFDLYQGFDVLSVANTYDRLPFLLGASCGVAGVDHTEDPSIGRPLIERFLIDSVRGPWGAFGPSRGTWQLGNELVASEFIKRAYVDGAASAGEAAMIAVRNVAAAHPELAAVAREYVFIGDPVVRLPSMAYTLDIAGMVNGSGPFAKVRVVPNPARTEFAIVVEVTENSTCNAELYDLQGRRVAELGSKEIGPGVHSLPISVHGPRPGPGVYFLSVRIGEVRHSRRVVLVH